MKGALDFGTVNSVFMWLNPATGKAEPFQLDGIQRAFSTRVPGQPRPRQEWVVPSLIHYGENDSQDIGEQVRASGLTDRPSTFRWFKMDLLHNRQRQIQLNAQKVVSTREAAEEYLKNILAFARGAAGEPFEELVVTTPVEAYDPYVQWLRETVAAVTGATVRTLDEATACILGYQSRVKDGVVHAVCDFGGGTFDVSIVRSESHANGRKVVVLGRAGAELGGMHVDRWMQEKMLADGAMNREDLREVGIPLLDAIEQAKMDLSEGEASATVQQFNRVHMRSINYEFTRQKLVDLLAEKKFGVAVSGTIQRALENARDVGTKLKDIQGVFLVGGTSKLLGVREAVATAFPDLPIHADNPFLAIAAGACQYAGGRVDFRLVHDYGVMSHNRVTGQEEFFVIVPKGTQYPTEKATAFELSASCYESSFIRMIICERSEMIQRGSSVGIGPDGRLRVTEEKGESRVQIRQLNPKAERFLRPQPVASYTQQGRFVAGFRVDEHRNLLLSLQDTLPGNQSYIITVEGEKKPLPIKAFPLVRLG